MGSRGASSYPLSGTWVNHQQRGKFFIFFEKGRQYGEVPTQVPTRVYVFRNYSKFQEGSDYAPSVHSPTGFQQISNGFNGGRQTIWPLEMNAIANLQTTMNVFGIETFAVHFPGQGKKEGWTLETAVGCGQHGAPRAKRLVQTTESLRPAETKNAHDIRHDTPYVGDDGDGSFGRIG